MYGWHQGLFVWYQVNNPMLCVLISEEEKEGKKTHFYERSVVEMSTAYSKIILIKNFFLV